MKIVFFGTPNYVVPIVDLLHKTFRDKKTGESPIVAVVTQGPKPVGRKQVLTYSPIDKWAHEQGVEIFFDFEKELPKADVGILASYGGLIPQEVIKKFHYGVLVVHPSLLPKFRWGSPVPASIITNSNPTGVTIMKMDEKFDHGPIVSQSKENILDTDTTKSLRDRLFEKSGKILVELLEAYIHGKIKLKEQGHDEATFARQIKKEEGLIKENYLKEALSGKTFKEEWQIPFIKGYSQSPSPENIERFIRAMQDWPQAWTIIKLSQTGSERRLKLLSSHIENGKLVLDEVQLEGKNPGTWKQFVQAYPQNSLISN